MESVATPNRKQVAAAAGNVLYHIRDWVMPERCDWNRKGPYVPLWFRRQLRRIDPKLTLQYIPPSTTTEKGVNPARHPCGVWAICRRLRCTGFLFKRWSFALIDRFGLPVSPTMDMIHLIRAAHRLWRCGQVHQVEDHFDQTMGAIKKAKSEESKERLMVDLEDSMRRHGFTSGSSRVFCPA